MEKLRSSSTISYCADFRKSLTQILQFSDFFAARSYAGMGKKMCRKIFFVRIFLVLAPGPGRGCNGYADGSGVEREREQEPRRGKRP
jgi:hypothetical protein